MQRQPDAPANAASTSLPRRAFVLAASAGGVALALGAMGVRSALASHARDDQPAPNTNNKPVAKAPKPLRLLILGGTGFLGPAVVEVAKARGHSLTLFNRGRTEKRIGIIDDVEKLYGNRDPNLVADETDPQSPKGLTSIEAAIEGGAKWDGVVDTSGYFPRAVKASAELLAKAARQYVFVSTISVYANNDTPNEDESATIATTDTPASEQFQAPQLYGPLKALCEQAAETAMPGKVTNIRPGFIVGPGDPTDRFTYWPVRAAMGASVTNQPGKGEPADAPDAPEAPWDADMLAPGGKDDPIQFIDVRDLAAFIVHCIEQQTVGIFNATGPNGGLGVGAFIDACVQAAKDRNATQVASPVWVDWPTILSNDEAQTTVIIPPVGETAGFHQRNVSKALAAGLILRSPLETCKDTLAWWPKEVARRDRIGKQMVEDATKAGKTPPTLPPAARLRAGMPARVEREVIAAFRAK